MKVKGLDGKMYAWNYTHTNNVSREGSSYAEKANELIKKLYPTDRLWREVSLPGTRPTLYADFILPQRRIMIEVHGPQHYEHNDFFHSTQREFAEARRRDEKKKEWAEINNFHFVELSYLGDENDWRRIICGLGEE